MNMSKFVYANLSSGLSDNESENRVVLFAQTENRYSRLHTFDNKFVYTKALVTYVGQGH